MYAIHYNETFSELEFRRQFKESEVQLLSISTLDGPLPSLIYKVTCPQTKQNIPVIVIPSVASSKKLDQKIKDFEEYFFA